MCCGPTRITLIHKLERYVETTYIRYDKPDPDGLASPNSILLISPSYIAMISQVSVRFIPTLPSPQIGIATRQSWMQRRSFPVAVEST